MKTPPHAVECEQSLLGSLLMDSSRFPEVAAVVRTDDFYREDHRILWATMVRMLAAGAFDAVLLLQQLRQEGTLENAGGASYVMGLASEAWSAANAVAYARQIADKARARRLIAACHDAADAAFKGEEADAIAARLSDAASAAQDRGYGEAVTFRETLADGLEAAREAKRKRAEGKDVGVPFGVPSLDRMTGGLQESDLFIVGARPGAGKTALALQATVKAATRGHGVLFCSLEMPSKALGQRALAAWTRSNFTRLRLGDYEQTDESLAAAVKHAGQLPIWLDFSTHDLAGIVGRMTQLRGRGLISAAVVDYIGLIGTQRFPSRDEQLGHISRTLKLTANKLRMPIMAIHQLNRESVKEGRAPELHDLRGSGNLEQDADSVLFLHVPRQAEVIDVATQKPVYTSARKVELYLAKNRGGRVGRIDGQFEFDGPTQTFRELTTAQDGRRAA